MMTPRDREKFEALARRQAELEVALTQLRIELKELERHAEQFDTSPELRPVLPPLPVIVPSIQTQVPPIAESQVMIEKEGAPVVEDTVVLSEQAESTEAESAILEPESSPIPPPFAPRVKEKAASEPLPPLPVFPSTETGDPQPEKVGLEFQFGRWLARIGVVFALITLVSFSTLAYKNLYHYMGPWSKLAVLTLVSGGLVAAGLWMERKKEMRVYGRTVAGGGLACLYYTLYGATYVSQLQAIHSTLFGGFLLLGWSAGVLWLAEKKKSELLSIFAIALAYFSSAITPVGSFTMVANLILSVTAVIFLVRNAWTGLSYLCLIGTYVGLLRQYIVIDGSYNDWVEFVHGFSFWPSAAYLAGAWVIYTTGVFLAATPNFAAGKRMLFLCLNNGALISLLVVASELSGFGHIGGILCIVGGVLMVTAYVARQTRADAGELAGAFLAQGLALTTGGVVIAYTGVTRGLLITVESVFLAACGAFARNRIMRIAGYISAFLGTAFLFWEITPGAAHGSVIMAAGAAAMLANAWLARREFWHEAREISAKRFVLPSAFYALLATTLLTWGIPSSPLSPEWTTPVMALVALALTFSVYLVPISELPVVIQILLAFALRGATFPLDDTHAWWSELIVGGVTMTLVTWWLRQKMVRTDNWLWPALSFYALAMVALSYCLIHPHVDTQGWMIAASLLSLGFLLYGFFARNWPFAIAGQILLAVSIEHFFSPIEIFPWAWWAAVIPIAVAFCTAQFVQRRLDKNKGLGASPEIDAAVKMAVFGYQCLTIVLIVRYIFGLVPDVYVPLSFYAVGAVLTAWNVMWPSARGVRFAMVLDLFGTLDYLEQVSDTTGYGATWSNAFGLVLLLAQPFLLRRWGAELVSKLEISGLTFLGNLSTSLYVYWIIHPRVDAEGWMVAASILSVLYVAYGAGTRAWQFMISGQVYLGMAIWTFFNPPSGPETFPWEWWAAALPPAVVFLTGWYVDRKLPRLSTWPAWISETLDALAYIYKTLALVLLVRWIFGIVPETGHTLALFVLGSGLLYWNLRRPSEFGVQAAFAVDLVASGNYFYLHNLDANHGFTWADAFAFALFLGQPAMLRRWGRELVAQWESWAVILISAGMAWLFVSNSVAAANPHDMTVSWAIFSLVLAAVGFGANDRRQRWCGLAILVAAIIRVGVYDFWLFSDLYKVLTFFVLTVICLGLSFLYYKFADRLKEWL